MEKFRSKRLCKTAVIVEMILAALSIFVSVGFIFARLSEPDEDEFELTIGKKPQRNIEFSEILLFSLQALAFIHFIFLVLVFFTGQRVLAEACVLSPQVMDIGRLDAGVKACNCFASLELWRIVIVIGTLFGELLLLQLSLGLQAISILFNLPALFGWFFSSELAKELSSQGDELKRLRELYPSLPPSTSFSNWLEYSTTHNLNCGHLEDNVNNRQVGEALMYSAPSVAVCMNNLMR